MDQPILNTILLSGHGLNGLAVLAPFIAIGICIIVLLFTFPFISGASRGKGTGAQIALILGGLIDTAAGGFLAVVLFSAVTDPDLRSVWLAMCIAILVALTLFGIGLWALYLFVKKARGPRGN